MAPASKCSTPFLSYSLLVLLLSVVSVSAGDAAGPIRHPRRSASTGPIVDLDYEIYEGIANTSTGLNMFFGVRYAAPTQPYRFQSPQPPASNRSHVISAATPASKCPQALTNPYTLDECNDIQGDATLPSRCADNPLFEAAIEGDEDCLFLNVYAPMGKKDLPVFLYIHGGGYGAGDAESQDPTVLLNSNGNTFIAVIIQYRLGAFGFLASDEVYRLGTLNAGLQDQHFALEWVQKYISRFGGDPSHVTVAGESAGAGSVMLQVMWEGGEQGNTLFQNAIAASPYLPMQYNYSDFAPSQFYYALAARVGCLDFHPGGGLYRSVFSCLASADSLVLQQVNAIVSAAGMYGTWGFLPVTDGKYVQGLPSQQLKAKKVNGVRMLSGNCAEEGPLFTPQIINTAGDFTAYVKRTFPLFTSADVAQTDSEYSYPGDGEPTDPSAPRFATTGLDAPSTLSQGSFGTGQQARADALYGETTFFCPGYWLAEAFTGKGAGYAGWKYQYSVPAASHGSDLDSYFSPVLNNTSEEFVTVVRQIWGNFTVHDDPSLALSLDPTLPSFVNNSVLGSASSNKYPQFPYMLNLNETGGTPSTILYDELDLVINVTENIAPGLRTDFSIVDANSWEAGRGARCDFWRDVAPRVPE